MAPARNTLNSTRFIPAHEHHSSQPVDHDQKRVDQQPFRRAIVEAGTLRPGRNVKIRVEDGQMQLHSFACKYS